MWGENVDFELMKEILRRPILSTRYGTGFFRMPTIVSDNEKFYRAVDPSTAGCTITDGQLRVSANAFNDSNCQPSGDRSSLRADPADAKRRPADAIIQVITKEIRDIVYIRIAPNDKTNVATYLPDVIHRPVCTIATRSENLAHCQIECLPEIKNTHFKKLKAVLARLAEVHGLIVQPE